MARVHPLQAAGLKRLERDALTLLAARLDDQWRIFPRLHFRFLGNHHGDSDLDLVLLHPGKGLHLIEAKDIYVHNTSQAPEAEYGRPPETTRKPLVPQLLGQRRVLAAFLKRPELEAQIHTILLAPHSEESLQGDVGEIRDPEIRGTMHFVRGQSLEPLVGLIEENAHSLAGFDEILRQLLRAAEATDTNDSQAVFHPGESGLTELRRFHTARAKNRIVRGVAGTGKTQVLLREAAELRASGKRVLLLCYNELLCLDLRRRLPGCEILTLDSLLREVLGPDYVPPSLERAEEYESQFITASKRIESGAGRFRELDHLIIDEAQDPGPAHWMTTVALQSASEARVTLAYDETQKWRVHSHSLEEIVALPWGGRAPWEREFVLKQNLRNGAEVRELAFDFLARSAGTPFAQARMQLDQNRPGWSHAPPPELLERSRIVEVLASQLRRTGAGNDTLVLTSDSKDWLRSSPGAHPGIFPAAEALAALGDRLSLGDETTGEAPSGKALLDTVLRCKGLEARHVIVFLKDERTTHPESCFQKAYIAATRATHWLQVYWVKG